MKTVPVITPLLLREREAATMLAVSASQIGIWRRAGLLHAVRLPGLRAIRYDRDEVELLARRWCAEAKDANKQLAEDAA